MRTALRKLKDGSLFGGPAKKGVPSEGSRFYSDSEIASLRQQLKDNSALAQVAARKGDAKLHPRLAALKERKKN